jgi:hypothetical protein
LVVLDEDDEDDEEGEDVVVAAVVDVDDELVVDGVVATAGDAGGVCPLHPTSVNNAAVDAITRVRVILTPRLATSGCETAKE